MPFDANKLSTGVLRFEPGFCPASDIGRRPRVLFLRPTGSLDPLLERGVAFLAFFFFVLEQVLLLHRYRVESLGVELKVD